MTDTRAGERPVDSRRNRLALGAGAVIAAGALAFGGVALTNAFFTSQAQLDGQSVGTTTVEIGAGIDSGNTPIAVSDFLPGDETDTIVEVRNSGGADVFYTVGDFEVRGDQALAEALVVELVLDGGDIVETHTLAQWQHGAYQGLVLEAGAIDDIGVTVSLPATPEPQNQLQGLSAEFDIVFTAIQQANVPAPAPGWFGTD